MYNKDITNDIKKTKNELNIISDRIDALESMGGVGNGSGANISFKTFIKISEWKLIDGVYIATIAHSLNTKDVIVCAYDSQDESIMVGKKIIDRNNIEIKSNSAIDLSLIIVNAGIPINRENVKAEYVSFNNSTNGMNANNAQTAIEENNTSIKAIESEFDRVENTKYTTANGIKEFECKDGYIDNVVIEGQTLVNYFIIKNIVVPSGLENKGSYTLENNGFTLSCTATPEYYVHFNYQPLTKGRQYTICFDLEINKGDVDVFEIATTANLLLKTESRSGKYKLLFTPSADTFDLRFDSNYLGTVAKFKNVMILEGDWTNKEIPPYFEGLKSIGQGDKIEVLTRETNKTNLLKSQNITYKDNYMISYATGLESASSNHKYTETYIEIESDTDYCFYHVSRNMCWYDSNKTLINSPLNERTFGIDKDLFYSAKSPKNAKYLRVTIIKNIHNNGETSEIYKGKYDKKQILTTLRSGYNGYKDSIYKQGDKYYKNKMCTEFVIDGNFNVVSHYIVSGANIRRIQFDISQLNIGVGSSGYGSFTSDKIVYNVNYDNTTPNRGFISDKGKYLWLFFDNSVVTSDNWKTYLNNNPITFVTNLATPIQEELPNFNPRIFNNKSTILINSGAVQADASFEVTNSTRSELEVLKGKVSDLDDNVVDEEVYYPTLLNGWTDRYSSNPLKISKIGDIVVMEGNLYSGTVTAGTLIFTIPEKFRPKRNMFTTVCSRATKTLLGTFSIGSNGNVVIQDNGFGDGSSSSGGIAFSYTYSLI